MGTNVDNVGKTVKNKRIHFDFLCEPEHLDTLLMDVRMRCETKTCVQAIYLENDHVTQETLVDPPLGLIKTD